MTRSRLSLAGMGAVLLACAWVIAGGFGALLTLAALAVLGTAGPRISAHAAMRLHGAIPLYPTQVPGLYGDLVQLARRVSLPAVPRLYRLRTGTPAAFTVGIADDPAIAISDGLMYTLGARERMGVLAHEVAHLAAGDVAIMRLGDLMRRIATLLCHTALITILLTLLLVPGTGVSPLTVLMLAATPIALGLLQLALSRDREFAADEAAARLTGDPAALASALRKLEANHRWSLQRLLGQLGGFDMPSCLRTHPATDARIARLARIGREMRRRTAGSRACPTYPLMRFDASGNPF